MERQSGILMPIFSLPNKYGIGSFGKESYDFIDFLASAGQKVWQILPLVQTGFGDSPYSSVCSYSFNPYFISVDALKKGGLITASEAKFSRAENNLIDYGNLYAVRYPLLRKAFSRFDKNDKEFLRFLRKGEFHNYALFMAIKDASGQKHFNEWEDGLKRRDKKALKRFARSYRDEINFWQFVQFIAQKQWFELKRYANSKGVKIMGDMPIYVAFDSVDVWENPHLFKLNNDYLPLKVAGVPPDYFSETGQLWGNPVYNYTIHEQQGFSWWIERIKNALNVFDYVRIDHFRAFDRYYEIEAKAVNAKVGEWINVPSKELFDTVHEYIDKTRIIAEDLGIIDDGVRDLLRYVGYPGMKILSFAFDGTPDNLYLPEVLPKNSICYTGTHDNDTLMGLINSASEWDKNNLVNGVKNSLKKMDLDLSVEDNNSLASAMIELGCASKANTFIMPLSDVLFKDGNYRINEPGTTKGQNWAVRFDKKDFSKAVCQRLRKLTNKYHR